MGLRSNFHWQIPQSLFQENLRCCTNIKNLKPIFQFSFYSLWHLETTTIPVMFHFIITLDDNYNLPWQNPQHFSLPKHIKYDSPCVLSPSAITPTTPTFNSEHPPIFIVQMPCDSCSRTEVTNACRLCHNNLLLLSSAINRENGAHIWRQPAWTIN